MKTFCKSRFVYSIADAARAFHPNFEHGTNSVVVVYHSPTQIIKLKEMETTGLECSMAPY